MSLMLMSGKGEPLAKMARPPVHLWAATAVHSAREVGLDRGKMTGASVPAPIAVSTSSEKSPPTPDRPGQQV